VIQPDASPAFYAYRMTPPDGTAITGVIGALGCEPPGGDVLPHEQTIPKDTTDRLDCSGRVGPTCRPSGAVAHSWAGRGVPTRNRARRACRRRRGVVHSLWVLDDPKVAADVARRVGASPVVIADGHHRYETAVRYQAERRAETTELRATSTW